MHGLSCSVACGNFWDQRSNLCLPYWQVDSYLLHHQWIRCPNGCFVFFSDGIINGNKLIYLKYVAKLESVGLSDGLNVMNDGNEEVMKMSRSVG